MHVLIAGCGWLGRAVGRALAGRGDRVTGARRSRAGHDELRALGIEPVALDLTDWHGVRGLPEDVDAVVACQAAGGDAPEAYRSAYVDANATLLEYAGRCGVERYVYTGSTGVFGQSDGGEVDEATTAQPRGAGAEILLEAERLVVAAHLTFGVPASLVRLSGLYGPGRIGVIERVRRGELALGSGDDAWMNWCHLDDAVATILAILDRGRTGAVYHASDASPATRADVITWIAGRLGITPPRRPDDVRAQGGRRGANRRISAAATRAELGLALAYPSFRDGLAPFLPPG